MQCPFHKQNLCFELEKQMINWCSRSNIKITPKAWGSSHSPAGVISSLILGQLLVKPWTSCRIVCCQFCLEHPLHILPGGDHLSTWFVRRNGDRLASSWSNHVKRLQHMMKDTEVWFVRCNGGRLASSRSSHVKHLQHMMKDTEVWFVRRNGGRLASSWSSHVKHLQHIMKDTKVWFVRRNIWRQIGFIMIKPCQAPLAHDDGYWSVVC